MRLNYWILFICVLLLTSCAGLKFGVDPETGELEKISVEITVDEIKAMYGIVSGRRGGGEIRYVSGDRVFVIK